MPRITSLFTYPSKGMQGFPDTSVRINPQTGIVGDRNFAYARRPQPETEQPATWAPKPTFYVGMNTPGMVSLPAGSGPTAIQKLLNLAEPPEEVLTHGNFNMTDTEGPTVSLLNMATFRLLEDFIRTYVPEEPEPPRPSKGIIEAVDHMMDNIRKNPDDWPPLPFDGSTPQKNPLRTLSPNQPLNPQRFRMNLQIDDWEPFAELDLATTYPGTRQISIGEVTFEVHDACERCKATQANPETGTDDLDTLKLLRAFMTKYRPGYRSPHRGHNVVMGLILKPLTSGTLKLGDELHL